MLILKQLDDTYYNDEFEWLMDDIQGLQVISIDRYHNQVLGDKNMVDTDALQDIFQNIFGIAWDEYELNDYEDFSVLKGAQIEIREKYDLDISITNLYKLYFENYGLMDDFANFKLYKKLFDKNYKIYESRGYNQGDFAYIVYDANLYDDEYIEYIDALLWGKYNTFDLMDDENDVKDTYTILHDYTYNENVLIDYVKNNIDYKIDLIQTIDGYKTIPTYNNISL